MAKKSILNLLISIPPQREFVECFKERLGDANRRNSSSKNAPVVIISPASGIRRPSYNGAPAMLRHDLLSSVESYDSRSLLILFFRLFPFAPL